MEPTTSEGFISYPTNRVVGTITDAARAHAAIDALLQAGFERADVEILHGQEDMHRLDPTGAEHGVLEQLQRTLIRVIGRAEEYKHLTHHVDDLRAGRFVIMVLAREREQRAIAADILNANGAEFIAFYGRWAWEAYAPAARSAADAARSSDDAAHELAHRPEQIPALFVEAWNERDPDRIASLFDEGAEFVNVTGRWWHGRASIRNAHAYGLERMFNESTLTADEVRVKHLSDAVAVVHARLNLSGQTAIGSIKRPGSRTKIVSFVVHRVGETWLCASAQDTDVVPQMDTNVIDDDGSLRAANYQSGRVS